LQHWSLALADTETLYRIDRFAAHRSTQHHPIVGLHNILKRLNPAYIGIFYIPAGRAHFETERVGMKGAGDWGGCPLPSQLWVWGALPAPQLGFSVSQNAFGEKKNNTSAVTILTTATAEIMLE